MAIAMHPFRTVLLGAVIVALVAGCASYSGRGLKPGIATEAEVRQVMGTPAAVWEAPEGQVWAYPRGPLGRQTYLVHFSPQGTLATIEQVLDEEHFEKIKAGEMAQEDVRHLIGPPFQTVAFPRRNELAWDYRFRDTWGFSAIFSVIFDQAGRVKGTVTVREFVDDHDRHRR